MIDKEKIEGPNSLVLMGVVLVASWILLYFLM